jgi:hypothetical protein
MYDIAANGFHTWTKIRDMPPDQMLRHVFETCRNYDDAREMLQKAPIARPAIFLLVGCAPGERCVIERTERGYETREDETSAANDWSPSRPKWEARMPAGDFLTRSSEAAASKSRARQESLARWQGAFSDGGFDWVAPPILNSYTRLAITMCPAHAIMRAVGYDNVGADLPEPVTQIFETPAEMERKSRSPN